MIDRTVYIKEVKKAVKAYWFAKSQAIKKKEVAGKKDQGKRGGATAGKNFDGFAQMFEKLIRKYASKDVKIHQNKAAVVLPGYFRPTKQWDLVLMHKGRLIAALELKALGGPSFGNNANNRCEEALGSGLDFETAQREGAFGKGVSPFVGYFILVEDAEGSRRLPKRGNPSKHFPSDPIFVDASYQGRMRILCERMIQEKLYTSAAVMASAASAEKSGAYYDLSDPTSLYQLVARLLAHVKVETA